MASTRILRIAIGIASALSLTAGVTGSAMADTQWQANHPRRAEVNHRLNNQARRIHHDVKDGSMTKAQAHQLRTDDHDVRQEERDMASMNGSHITKQEQRTLNQQENAVSGDIHRDAAR